MQRILLTTKKGMQYVIGYASAGIYHWDNFMQEKACLTGMFGLTYNSSVISVGFYFNSEVLPDGQMYNPYEKPKLNETNVN